MPLFTEFAVCRACKVRLQAKNAVSLLRQMDGHKAVWEKLGEPDHECEVVSQ
jgi:hypothetical protein